MGEENSRQKGEDVQGSQTYDSMMYSETMSNFEWTV